MTVFKLEFERAGPRMGPAFLIDRLVSCRVGG